ncbi:MAG: sorbitol-6-phosphate dehydrogenase [Clostridiales bacterium]|jgi:sorbitol-6-phosphate 2-dehydrogenase|nr:sorbitol-6-phosphate dehydrogenase [Clostridiales bacterium]
MVIDISCRTAVVTGGGQGLGEALALRLDREGCNVVVADINYEAANAVAQKCRKAVAVKVDVTDFSQCLEMARAAEEAFGAVDILVCNAAILKSGDIESLSSETFRQVVDVNLNGYFNTVKAIAPSMLKRRKGSIIQINSKSGKKGSYKNGAYAASKFGAIGLTQSLALEFAPYNVRVNCICPGNLLNSPLWVNSLFKQYAQNQGITEEEVRMKYISQVPLGRSCEYEDIENALVFLASDASSYMTGQAINVTGGQQMSP